MKYVYLVGVMMFLVGGLSFLLITNSEWLERSAIAQVLNLVAWLIALIGLFSVVVGGLVQAIDRQRLGDRNEPASASDR